MVLLGIPMAIMVVASFSEGVWYGILTLIGMLLLGYVIFGIGVVAALFAEGIVHILRLLFGVDKTAVANKKQNIESRIRSERQKIDSINANIESITELNDTNRKKYQNIKNEHYISFINSATNEVKTIIPQIGLLKDTYNDIVHNFFFSTSPIEKTNNEMDSLIKGYFPYKASLSKEFHQKLKEIALDYENEQSEVNSIEEKLLFNKPLALEDIKMIKNA